LRGALLIALALLAGCGALREVGSSSYGFFARFSHPPEERNQAPHGIEIACARATFNYVVPVEGGVVLVDAGFDEAGVSIRRVIGERRVLAVLLTHAHIDHKAAAHLFDAPVYVGRGDLPWFDDDWHLRAIGPAAGRRFFGRALRPARLVPVDHREVVEVGGARFIAHSVPGHTPGSVAWQFRDVLFTGDAAHSPDGELLYPAPWTVSENPRQAWRSLRRFVDVDFDTILDGHYGRTDGARRLLRRTLDGYDDSFPYEYPAVHALGCAER
jgi:glyoxylase-like metal-dependent hydrolase (beta-lactamase superfamily II)